MLVKLVKIVINHCNHNKTLTLSCLYTPQLDQLIRVTEGEEARNKTQRRKYHGNCYIQTN